MTKSIEATVRELADLEAIRDLARRYAHYVWQSDIDGVIELFTDDGEMDPGVRPPIKGRAALLEGFKQMLLAGGSFRPFISQHVVDVAGDEATGFCYIDLRAAVAGTSMIGGGWYEDRYARTEKGWRFRRRKVVLSFFAPISEGWAQAQAKS
jgi:ketosteroid isomerase-like protein